MYIPRKPGAIRGASIKESMHNLYFNEMYKALNSGYVIFLDDDDQFELPQSLQLLSQLVTNTEDPSNSVFFWRVRFPDNLLIPRDPNNFEFRPGNISGIGFCFHSSYCSAAAWDHLKESDFRVAHKLKIACRKSYFVPLVLTGLQRESGWGGFGARDDLDSSQSRPNSVADRSERS